MFMTAAAQSSCKKPDHRPNPEIFGERAGMRRITVNVCLAQAPCRKFGQTVGIPRRLSDYRRSPTGPCAAMPASFAPCVNHAVDGIFRPGGGGPGRYSDDVLGKLPIVKNQPRAAGLAMMAGGKFDWPMSSFSKPTD